VGQKKKYELYRKSIDILQFFRQKTAFFKSFFTFFALLHFCGKLRDILPEKLNNWHNYWTY